MKQCSFDNAPDSFLKKWQEIADLIANVISVPAALIMKTENEFMEVFVSSKTDNNPYNIGDKEHWHGLYCETVIKTQKKLNIPNALKDKNWDKNPDIKLGMIAYLGFPINFPDKTPFGTLCVLDREERQFTIEQEKILLQFKNTIELDLALICALELEKNSNQSDVIKNLLNSNDEYQVMNEEYLTTNEELLQANDELHQAKRNAEENEEKYRRIADNVTDVVWITDLEMNPTYISPSVERIYGITPEEYLKRPLSGTYPSASIEKFKKILAEQFAKEQDPEADKNRTFQLEVERYYADGTLGWDVINATFIRDKQMNPVAIQGVSHDITERKKAEKSLQEKNDLLQKVFDSNFDLVALTDLEGTYRMVGKSHEIIGYDIDYLIGKNVMDFVHTDDVAHVGKEFTQFLQSGENRKIEYRYKRGDGIYLWFETVGTILYDEQGNPEQILFNTRNVTERKKAEEALQSNYALLQIAGKTARFGGWSVDLEKNTATWSDVVADIHEVPHGYAPPVEKAINFYAPEWREKIVQVFGDCAQKGISYDEEMEIITAKGKRVWVRANGKAIKDQNGKIIKVQGSFQDITERKQAEKALNDSTKKLKHWHELLSYIIKHNRSAVAVHDRKLNYVYVSQRYMDIYNVKDPDIIGKHHYDVFPNLPQKWRDVHQKALAGEVHSADEDPFYRADGSMEWTRWECRPWFEADSSIGGIIVYTEVITERKEREQQLTEQKDLLAAIYRNAPLVMMVVNAERRVQQVNGFATQFVGRDSEEMLGLRGGEALRCIHVLDDPKGCGFGDFCQQCVIRNSVLDTLETAKTHLQVEAPYFFIGDDNQIKEMTFLTSTTPIQIKGEPMVLVTLQDITERKNADAALKESEVRFKALHNASFGGITIHDKGIILECNQGLSEMTGYSIDELIGMDGLLLIAPETRDMVMDRIVSGYEKPYEALGLRKNGNIYPLRLEARNIPYKGKIVRTVEFRDITENKKAEELLREHTEKIKAQNEDYESINEELRQTNEELYDAKEKAEEGNRLKTAFLQNMSHEIRTPLNAISGFSGMLNKPKLKDEKRKKFVSIIQNSSQQLVAIITDILTISSLDTKQEKLNMTVVDINSIIAELHAIFKSQAQRQGVLLKEETTLSDNQSNIYTDKTKVTQIFTNLLSNALKFTHQGFVEMGYTVKTDSESAIIEFYVKDSGIGMTPAQQEIVFERFQQAHKSINKFYGGTGLGLSISKGFAELLGGKIWVESTLNQGSTFYFTIPFKPVAITDKISPQTSQNGGSGTILVAEDEELNFVLIQEYLSSFDVKLIHAKDGQETIDICKENPDIDLVLMDIKMPKITGDEAAKIIKQLKPDLPIVAQSAYIQEHDIDRFSDVFDAYLTKPIAEDVLKQIVNKFINIQKE